MSHATITMEELLALAEERRAAPETRSPLPEPVYSLEDPTIPALASWIPGFLLPGSFTPSSFLRDEEDVLGLIADFAKTNKCRKWHLSAHPSVIHLLPTTLRARATAGNAGAPVGDLWVVFEDFGQGRWRPDTVR